MFNRNTFQSYLRKESANLEKMYSKEEIQSLRGCYHSEALKKWLLGKSPNQDKSRIEVLMLAAFKKNEVSKKNLLEQWVKNLDSDDWVDLIVEADIVNLNFAKKDTLDNILDFLLKSVSSNKAKIAILTQNIRSRELGAVSIVTHPSIPLEKIFNMISSFTDNEKMNIILQDTELSDCLLLRAEREGKFSELSKLIQNEAIRKELVNLESTYKDELNLHNTMKKLGHFLGVKKHDPLNEKDIDYEGLTDERAYPMFVDMLKKYEPSESFGVEFDKIQHAFSHVDSWGTIIEQAKANFRHYQSDNLVIVPSGWPGHSITIAATDKFLVVGNRGEGMHQQGGCIIYRLTAPLTEDDIKNFTRRSSQATINSQIRKIVEKDQYGAPEVFQAIPLQSQKYGTCHIANKKAVIAGLLPLLRAQRENTNDETLFSEFLLTEASKEYKRFTHFSRKSTLDEIAEAMRTTLVHRRETVMKGLVDYCNQHLDINSDSELALLHDLIKSFSENEINEFLDKLNIDAKIVLGYIYENGIEKPIPEYIKDIARDDSVNDADSFSRLYSYFENDLDKFTELLSFKARRRALGETPLMFAIDVSNISYAKKLIEEGNAIDDQTIQAALISPDMKVFELVVKASSQESDIFSLAMQAQTVEKIKWLLNAQPGPSLESINDALCNIGSIGENSIEIAEMLIEHGAEIHPIDQSRTPLSSALMRQDVKLAEFLINKGAGANDDGTLLFYALEKGSIELVKLLLTKHADLYIGKVPIVAAVQLECIEFAKASIKGTDKERLLSEFSDVSMRQLLLGLSKQDKKVILSELAQRLTPDELNDLNLVEKDDKRPKSVVFKAEISGALPDKLKKVSAEADEIKVPKKDNRFLHDK
jgi:ankyrin repeat protein